VRVPNTVEIRYSFRVKQWPHSPSRAVGGAGLYVVTAGTYRKEHHFAEVERLTLLHDTLLEVAEEFDLLLEAWAIFSNHYHYVGRFDSEEKLELLTRKLHAVTSRQVNRMDQAPGRKVWFSYWQTKLTFEESYLARLHYVHHNPVHHGLVREAKSYPYCSASWFEKNADPSWYKVVTSFPIDRVSVPDDF